MLENPVEWAWQSIIHSTLQKAIDEMAEEDIEELIQMALGCKTLPQFKSFLDTYRDDPLGFTEVMGILHTVDREGQPIWEEDVSKPPYHIQQEREKWEKKHGEPYPAKKKDKEAISVYNLLGENEEQRAEIHKAIQTMESQHEQDYYRRSVNIDNWELKCAVDNLANSVEKGTGMSPLDELQRRMDKFDHWKFDIGDESPEDHMMVDGEAVSFGYYRAFHNELTTVKRRAEEKEEVLTESKAKARAEANLRRNATRGKRLSNNSLERFMRQLKERGLFNERSVFQGDNYRHMTREQIHQAAASAVLKIAEDDVRELVNAHFSKFVRKEKLHPEWDSAVSKTIHDKVQTRIKNFRNANKPTLKNITVTCKTCSARPISQSRGCDKCDQGYITTTDDVPNEYMRQVSEMKDIIDAGQEVRHDSLLQDRIRAHTLRTGKSPEQSDIDEISTRIRNNRLLSKQNREKKARRKVDGRMMRQFLLEEYREHSIQRAMVDDLFIDIISGVKHQLGEEDLTTQGIIDQRALERESLAHKAKDWITDAVNSLMHKGLESKKGTNLGERRINKFLSVWGRLENEPELKRVILGMQDSQFQPLLGVCIFLSWQGGYINLNNDRENLFAIIARDISSDSRLAENKGESDRVITNSTPEEVEAYLQYPREPYPNPPGKGAHDPNPHALSLIPALVSPPLEYNDKNRVDEAGDSITIQEAMEKWAGENRPLSREEAQMVDITHSIYNFSKFFKESTSRGLTQNDLVAIADFSDVLNSLGFESHIPPKQVMQAIARAGDRTEVTRNMMDLFYLLCNDDGSDKSPEEIVQGNQRLWARIHDKYYAQVTSDVKGLKGRVPEGMAIGNLGECSACNGGKGVGGIGNCSDAGRKPGQCHGYYDKQGKPLPANLRGKLRPSSEAPTEYDENYGPFIEELRKKLMGSVTLPDGTEIIGSPENMEEIKELGGEYRPGILGRQLQEWSSTLRSNDSMVRCDSCNGSKREEWIGSTAPRNPGWSYDAGEETYSRPCEDCINPATGEPEGKRPNLAAFIAQINQHRSTVWDLGDSIRDEGFGIEDLVDRMAVREKLVKHISEEMDYPSLQRENEEKWSKGIIPKVDGDPHWPYDIHHLLLYPQFHKSDDSTLGRLTLGGLKKLREEAARRSSVGLSQMTWTTPEETPDIKGHLGEVLHNLFAGMTDIGNDFVNSMLSDDQADNVMGTDYMEELVRLLNLPEFNDELIQKHLDLIHAPDGDGRNSLLDPGGWNTQLYCGTCRGSRKQKSVDGHIRNKDCPDCVGTGSEGVRRLHEELKGVMEPDLLSRFLRESYHNQTLNLTGTRRPSIYSHPDVQHLPSGTGRNSLDILNSRERGILFGTNLPSSHSISGIEQLFRYDPGQTNQTYIQNLFSQMQRVHELKDELAEAYGKNKEIPHYKLRQAEFQLESMLSTLSEHDTQSQIEKHLGKPLDELFPEGVTLDTATDNIYSLPENFDFEKDDIKSIPCPSCTSLAGQGLLAKKYYKKDGGIKSIQEHMDIDDGFCFAALEGGLDMTNTNKMVRYARLMLDPNTPDYFKKLSRGIDNLSPLKTELKGLSEELMGQGDTFQVGGLHVSNIRRIDPQLLLLSRLQDVAGTNPNDIPTGRGYNYLGMSNEGYSETPLHSLLNVIQSNLPDPIDKNADDRIKKVFAMHVLDPTIGEKHHGDVLALPIAPRDGWDKTTVGELHPEDSFLIEWARKVLGKRPGHYSLDDDEKYELVRNMHTLAPLLALQRRFSEEIEKSHLLKEEMFPGGSTPYIFNFEDGNFLDMTLPSNSELPRGLLHDVFSYLRDTADRKSKLTAITGNNQTDYMNLFPYEHNPSMEFIMTAPLNPALKIAWITHDDETLAKFGDEWVVTGKTLPEIMESGLLDKFWECHTRGKDMSVEKPRMGHTAKGTKEEPIPMRTVTISGKSIPRSIDEFMYDGNNAFPNARPTTDFWSYLIREIRLRSRSKEESKERMLEATKKRIRTAHNRDGKESRCKLCMGPGHHIHIHQAMSDFGRKTPHIITYETDDFEIGDSIPWPHVKYEYEDIGDLYSPIPKHGVGQGFEQVDTSHKVTRSFLVDNLSPWGYQGRKGEEVWREAFRKELEDGLVSEDADFWDWATKEAQIQCIWCDGKGSGHSGTRTLSKNVRDDIENTLLMSTHFGNLGLGIVNNTHGAGFAPEQAIWEPLGPDEEDEAPLPFALFSGNAIAPIDAPFFNAKESSRLYDRLRRVQERLKGTRGKRRALLTSELENIQGQIDELGPAITESEKKLLGLNLDTGKWETDAESEEGRLLKLTVAELKQECKAKGLPTSGTKEVLREKIRNYQYIQYKQMEEDQEEARESLKSKGCEHYHCPGHLVNICPTCHEKDGTVKKLTGDDSSYCSKCKDDYGPDEVEQYQSPRDAVYGPHLEGTDRENLYGHYCEICQPKHIAMKDKVERDINFGVSRDKLFGGYSTLMHILLGRDKDGYITDEKIVEKYGPKCTFLKLSPIANRDRPGYHYVPMFQDIQKDPQTGKNMKGVFALGDAGHGFASEYGWGGEEEKAGFHDTSGWDMGGVANGGPWVKTNFERSGGVRGNQFAIPSGGKTHCKHCTHPLPSWWDYITEKVIADNPELGERVPCTVCSGNGMVFDYLEEKDAPCPKCNKGGKKPNVGTLPNPRLKQARTAEMKELKGLIECEDCGTKTHKSASHFYKSRSIGIPYFRGSRVIGGGGELYPRSMHHFNLQDELLQKRLQGLVEEGVDRGITACQNCSTIDRLKENLENSRWKEAYDKRGEEFANQDFFKWGAGREIDSDGSIVDCRNCGGRGHELAAITINGRLCTHEPIYTWYRPNFKVITKGLKDGPEIDIEQFKDSIKRRRQKVRLNKSKGVFEIVKPKKGESLETKNFNTKLDRLFITDTNGQFTLPVFRPHTGFLSKIGHKQDNNSAHESGFRGLPSVKTVQDFIKELNELGEMAEGPWEKHLRTFHILLRKLSRGTPFAGDFGPNKENFGAGEHIGSLFIRSKPLERLVNIVEKRKKVIKSGEELSDEDKAKLVEINQFLNHDKNLQQIVQGIKETAQRQYEIVPLSDEGFMVEDPNATVYTLPVVDPKALEGKSQEDLSNLLYLDEDGEVDEEVAREISPAYRLLRALEGEDGKGRPSVAITGAKTVSDTVSPSFLGAIQKYFKGASWGWVGSNHRESLKEEMAQGQRGTLSQRAEYIPRTLAEDHDKGTGEIGPTEASFLSDSDRTILDDEARGNHIDNALSTHASVIDKDGPVTHKDFLPITSPDVDDEAEDINRAITPLDFAWDNILKNIKMNQ